MKRGLSEQFSCAQSDWIRLGWAETFQSRQPGYLFVTSYTTRVCASPKQLDL